MEQLEAEVEAPRSGRLGANVVVSLANVVAVIASSLIAVPLLVDRLGLAGYGIWVLAQTVVIYVTTAENGFGPAIARFTSVDAERRSNALPLLILVVATYLVVGAVVVVLAYALGGTLVDAFDVPARFTTDAVAALHIVAWVTVAALIGAAVGQTLQGLERFTAWTLSNVAGSVVWLGWLVLALDHGARLTDVAHAALAQWIVVAVLRVWAVRDVLAHPARPLLPDRRLVKDVLRFSGRLQVAILSLLVNTQTDRVVVGAVAPATTLGQVGIATQVADAGRLVVSAAFPPLASRMATAYGGPGGQAALEGVLAASRRLWTIAVLGVVAVGCGAIVPAVRAWIGTGHGQAAGYAVALLVGYGYLWLPGPAFAYLRAVGRPRLEGNYGLATVVVNIATTIPLGIAFGATGVIVATTFAYVTTTTWVLRRIHHEVPATHEPREPARLALALTAAVGVALGGGVLLDAALPRLAALAAIGLLVLADLAAYFAFMLRATPAVALARLRAGMT